MPRRRSVWRLPLLAALAALADAGALSSGGLGPPPPASPGAAPGGSPAAASGVSGASPAAARRELRYLALGDSYTIGESVAVEGRWPMQLAAALRQRGLAVEEPQIVARTGWTVAELDQGIAAAGPHGLFDLVSLLIGVNDQYRGGQPEPYRAAFAAMLARAVAFAGGNPGRVVVLSIPDWSVTPFATGSGRDLADIAHQIRLFNDVNRQETVRAGAHYVDITPVSMTALGHPALIAADGLHPSAAMYTEWTRLALPAAAAALGR